MVSISISDHLYNLLADVNVKYYNVQYLTLYRLNSLPSIKKKLLYKAEHLVGNSFHMSIDFILRSLHNILF